MLTATAAVLLASVAWFVVATLHWPLVGDASLMHYVVFLMDRGHAPYREIADINLPGAYLPDWLVLHTLGPGALPWRLYDLLLLALAAAAIFIITRPVSRFAGLWAACLFALIHGRDGVQQTGQRDLTLAVLLLLGAAALVIARRRRTPWPLALFGLAIGAATTLKPTAAAFLLLALFAPRQRWQQARKPLASCVALVSGFLLPLLCAAAWLAHEHALSAFADTLRVLIPFHASLGRQSIPYLLRHAVFPLLPLVLLWLALLLAEILLHRRHSHSTVPRSSERGILLAAVLLAIAGYIVQGKGFPYQRYETLAFLLPLIGIDLAALLPRRSALRWPACLILVLAALQIGLPAAWMASRYDGRHDEFRTSLQQDLTSLAPQVPGGLNHHVFCLDSVLGCVTTLYDMRLEQRPAFVYDEFLFHPGGTQAVDQSRRQVWTALQAAPPAVLIVTDDLFPLGVTGYAKLDRWPAFAAWLRASYILAVERPKMPPEAWGGGSPFRPAGYRIYLLRSLASAAH